MDRAQRRSDRLAEKRRRAGKSSREMSVGRALDADAHEVDSTNLAEARAMNSARKAAALRESQTPRAVANTRRRNNLARAGNHPATKPNKVAAGHEQRNHERTRGHTVVGHSVTH